MRKAKTKNKRGGKRKVIGLGAVKGIQRSIAKIVDIKPESSIIETIEGVDVVAVTNSLQHGEFSPTHPLYNKFNHERADEIPLNIRDLENVANHLHNSNMRDQADEIRKIAKVIPPTGLVTMRDLSDRALPEPEPQISPEQAQQMMEMMMKQQKAQAEPTVKASSSISDKNVM